jgi:tetratricopeptide (TPR) repeat protein
MKFHNPGIFIALVLLFFAGAQNANAQEYGQEKSAVQNFRSAEVLMTRKSWDHALEALNYCLYKDASYTDAYYSRALVHEHLNSDDQALIDLNIYLEFRPDHYEALLSRAQLRLRTGQYEMARDDFNRLLNTAPGETTAVFFRMDNVTGGVDQVFSAKGAGRAYLFNFIGLADSKLGNFHEALVAFDSAISHAPDEPDTWVNRGIAKIGLTDTSGAIEDYRKALTISPHHALAKHNLAVVRPMAEGGALLDQAIEDNPNMPFAWAERAYHKQEKKQWREALADYNEAIRLNSDEKEYFLNRGLVKEKLRDFDGAYKDYTKAIALQERFEQAWLNRGNLLSRLGRISEAIEDYSVAISWSPAYGAAWYNRALARHRINQREAACADLQNAEKFGMNVPVRAKAKICEVQ